MYKYYYYVNYQDYEENLARVEIKYLFNEEIDKKYLFSNIDINPSNSPFIKYKISIIYKGNTLDDIINKIVINKLSFEKFKVHYIKSEYNDIHYKERLEAAYKIGYVINGFPDLHNPEVNLAITKVNNLWILGKYIKNDCKWQKHDEKPFSYSNALSTRMARAIINIATSGNYDKKIVDPCCGIGTVVIEGLDLGVSIKGFEISKPIACNARNNIEYLGYNRDIILCDDMNNINEKYDIAIVDIPYGLFSPTTIDEQISIINKCREICDRLLLVSFENMDNLIEEAGFKIIDKISFSKNKFTRYISVAI